METGSNIKPTFLASHEGLTKEDLDECNLSLLIGSNEFSWAIAEREGNRIVEAGRFSGENPLEFIQQWERLNCNFSSQHCAIRAERFQLVPAGLFDEKQASVFLYPGTPNPPTSRSFKMNAPNAFMVFPEANEIERTLIAAFPEMQVRPNAAFLIQSVLRKNRFDRPPQIYVDMSDGKTEIMIAAHKKLLLANVFETETDEDVLYHISNAMEVLGLPKGNTSVYLSGDIEVSGKRYNLFKTYLPKLEIFFGFDMPKVALALASVKKQEYLSLFNQFACV